MANDDYTVGTYSKLAEAVQKKQQPPIPVTKPVERTQNVPSDTENSSNRDTTIPSNHDTTNDAIETVRKSVKQLGKEAATYRFTSDEKRALADIVYKMKTSGVRTSENEITRIAINYLVWEYRKTKNDSILSRVVERLNA